MGAERHRLEVHCPSGNPNQATIHLDGKQLLFVTRVELVLDCETREINARLTVPAALVNFDVDAAAFIAAHAEPAPASPQTAADETHGVAQLDLPGA